MNIKLYFFILIMTGFWGIFAPNDVVMKLILPLVDFTAIICFLADYKKNDSIFKKPLLFLLIFICINILGVWILREQSIISSIRGTDLLSILAIYSIFLMHKLRFSLNETQKTLTCLMWTFIGCYLIQWIVFPFQIFFSEGDGALDGFIDSGNIRFRMQAQGIAFLCFFYAIYKMIIEKKWQNYLLAILSLIIIIMFEFRSQLIILPFILILQLWYYFQFKSKKVLWILVAILGIGTFLMQSKIVSNKIETLLSRNETQNFSNENYIRYKTFDYYTKTVPQNTYEKIMGTGLEGIDGNYQRMTKNAKDIGYIWADWGLIGLTWKLGIPGVLCLIWYSLKAFKISRKYPDIHYIGIWFLFLILIGTFNREFYRFGIFAIQAIGLYIIDLKYKRTRKIIHK